MYAMHARYACMACIDDVHACSAYMNKAVTVGKICMPCMYACHVCMHAMYVCHVCMYAMYVCMACIDDVYACHVCMYAMYVCHVCMHAMYDTSSSHACMHDLHARHACTMRIHDMHGVARMHDTHMHACMHDVVRHGCTCSRHLRPFGAKLGSTGNSKFAIFRSQPSLTSKLQKLRISTPLTQKRKGGRGVGGFWVSKTCVSYIRNARFFFLSSSEG